ncbi:BolA family protein [Saccharospirillum mangrovi]|uniref:BolA family protein n=1 Tax=Saccharospirillum mangrovi TaxID=2161747 RepID=UPI000D3A6014|nr:BolA/IbaG family iron-sulfur metabolism protein [Saccharospirillum mangrovi]
MSVRESIQRKLTELSPSHLVVENESHRHSVPANSETHFRLEIVSAQFEGLRSVKRHQLVYGLLQEELNGPVHALAIHAYAPNEWAGQAPDSPDCRGGNKL